MASLKLGKFGSNHFIFFCILSIFLIPIQIKAQYESPSAAVEKISSSPEVSELGRFEAIPVNMYSGIAKIEIPIHTIMFEDLRIPITLSYNSGGIRANQESTWIGLGWVMSGQPAIRRTVNGFDDLKNYGYDAGYIYQSRAAQYPEGASEAYLDQDDANAIYNSYIPGSNPLDLEPDLFEVNLFGGNYKFILQKMQEGTTEVPGKCLNNKNVKIIYDDASKVFQITDERGFKYYFNTKEYSNNYGSEPSPWALSPGEITTDGDALKTIPHSYVFGTKNTITSWLLDKVISPLNKELNFTYQPSTTFSFPQFQGNIKIAEREIYSKTYNLGSGSIGDNATELVSASITGMDNYYLTGISGPFGTIDFNLSNREDIFTAEAFRKLIGASSWYFVTQKGSYSSNMPDLSRRLDGMSVKNSNGKLIKDIAFNQSYFDQNHSGSLDAKRYLRLKLDDVVINDQKYSFEYEQSENLPAKDSKDVDFWGYYNGAGNDTRVPSYNRFFYTFVDGDNGPKEIYIRNIGASKKSNFNFGKIGNLKRIIYPTGGSSNFEYEAHDALVSVTPPYTVTERNSNGEVQRTDLDSEASYNFTYQYLKLANDPSYDLYYQQSSTSSGTVESPVGLNESFTLSSSTVVTCSASFECYTGCNNISYYSSYPIRVVENLNDPTIEYVLFKYGDVSSGAKSISQVLPPGDYKVAYRSAPYVAGNPGIPAIGIVEEQTGSQKPYLLNLPQDSTSNGQYSEFVETFQVGGSRIHSITNYDSNNNFASKKEYSYKIPNVESSISSSGVLMDDLIFHSKAYGYYSYTPESFGESPLTFSSNSTIRNNYSAQGSHIGYSFVTEKQLDTTDIPLGYTQYNFTNFSNNYFIDDFCRLIYNPNGVSGHNPPELCYSSILIGLPPENDHTYVNGNLLSKKVYNAEGDIVSQQINNYTTFSGPGDNSWQVRVMPLYPYDDYYFLNKLYFPYKIAPSNSFRSFRTESISTKFLMDNILTTTTRYNYDESDHFLLSKRVTNSDGKLHETVYKYPTDLVNEPYASELIQANRLSTPLMEEDYVGNSKITTSKTEYFKGASTNNYLLPKNLFQRKGSGVITEDDKKWSYLQYDSSGNPLEISKANGPRIVYLWGYNDQYPIAKIENATYSQVTSALSVSDLNSIDETDMAAINLLRSNSSLSQALITTYTYDPLVGVTSIRSPLDKNTHYIYDSFGRLQTVKDDQGNIIQEYEYHYKN